jgi:hypothetical protein
MSELATRIARLKASGDAAAKTDKDGDLVDLLHARIAELEAECASLVAKLNDAELQIDALQGDIMDDR